MDMDTEFRLPYFHFSTPACIRLNGSSDKPDTTEQIKEDVKCDVGSSEARQTRPNPTSANSKLCDFSKLLKFLLSPL